MCFALDMQTKKIAFSIFFCFDLFQEILRLEQQQKKEEKERQKLEEKVLHYFIFVLLVMF